MCSLAAGISGGLNLFNKVLLCKVLQKTLPDQTYNQEVEGVQSAEDS